MNKEELNFWVTCLSCIRPYNGSLIHYKNYDYKDSKITTKCKYATSLVSNGQIESYIFSEDKCLVLSEGNNCSPQLVCNSKILIDQNGEYNFYTIKMSNSVFGESSAENIVDKVIMRFIEQFGYIEMQVHVIKQKFKSTGYVKISVLVTDYQFEK